MSRPLGSEGRAQASAVLRTTGMIVGGLLAAASLWIIVTGDTTKRVQIGVLVGLWGMLIVAFAAFGRRHDHERDPEPIGSDVMLRPYGGLERMQDVAAMRDYEQSLREMLRREIQEAFQVELASLRSEVAALRSEVVEKVGGQLRLERIETTRLIGSDIEALQHEVRQLGMRQAVDAEVVDVTQGTIRPPVRPTAPVQQPLHPVQEQPVQQPPAQQPPAQQQPVQQQPVQQQPVQQPPVQQPPVQQPQPIRPEPITAPQPVVAAVEPQVQPVEPAPLGAATVNDDPFASLPRIRPFTEFELEPSSSVGMSIFDEAEQGGAVPVAPGRHASDVAAKAHPSGGRRRREADDGNDVLSQILQREGRRPSS